MPDTTTSTSTGTTTTTTPLVPPLPSEFEAVLPKASGTLCDQLTNAGSFDAKFAAFYRWMFKDDGTFTQEFKTMVCNIGCSGGTASTTLGTGTTTTTITTLSKHSWTLGKALTNPTGCCISSDGQTVAVSEGGTGNIWVSTDGGTTWASKATTQNWRSICCTSNAATMYAVISSGEIFKSTDTGNTWASVYAPDGISNAYKILCSADGSKVRAWCYTPSPTRPIVPISASTDGGSTWANIGGPAAGTSIGGVPVVNATANPDMSIILWQVNEFTFLDVGGGPRTFQVGSGNYTLAGPAMAANGTIFFLCAGSGLFTSTDGGNTWNFLANYFNSNGGIACSSTGTRVLIVTGGAQIIESFDSGQSITREDSARLWRDIACNPDATKAVAIAANAGIYIAS